MVSKIYTVGETTYDIIFRNGIPTGAIVGGSVLNTAVSLGRLGLPVSFISRIGNDKIGSLSIDFLIKNGVNVEMVTRFDGNSRLALAFLDEYNNAEYQFYKSEKAPSLSFPELDGTEIITFGSTNALREEGRNNLLLFLNNAHDKNILTIYDPNIREFGATELIEIRKKFEENLYLSKILKGSNQDFLRLYQTDNADEIYRRVSVFGVESLIVTHGAKPVELRTANLSINVDFMPVKTVSTIGAGDNFTSGLIVGLLKQNIVTNDLKNLTREQWLEILNYAISFASIVCTTEENYIPTFFANKLKW